MTIKTKTSWATKNSKYVVEEVEATYLVKLRKKQSSESLDDICNTFGTIKRKKNEQLVLNFKKLKGVDLN